MVPTFQYPHQRNQPPVLSINSLRWSAAHCAKMLSSYDRFIRGKRWKSQGAKSRQMMVGDQTLPIENASGASLLQLQCVAEHCHEEGQYLRTTFYVAFLNKKIELQHILHIWQKTFILGMFMCLLCAQNWQMLCVAIDEHTRNIVQHICTKVHLILTVVLISRPIGPWKNSLPNICIIYYLPVNVLC